jgi:hypothetical protein
MVMGDPLNSLPSLRNATHGTVEQSILAIETQEELPEER